MDVREFERHFKSLYLPLCIFALHFVEDRDTAEDVVQETFVKTWQKIENGLETDNFKSYIYRAVRNECISFLRNSNNIPIEESLTVERLDFLEDSDVVDSTIEEYERYAKLWKAIDSLPARCREIFLLSKRDGLSNEEISSRLCLSLQTVKNQMSKAYSKIRESNNVTNSGSGLPSIFFLPFI